VKTLLSFSSLLFIGLTLFLVGGCQTPPEPPPPPPPDPRVEVTIAGQVHMPGDYKVLPEETLDNALAIAGGFKPTTYATQDVPSSFSLIRMEGDEKKILNIPYADRNLPHWKAIRFRPDDRLIVNGSFKP